MRKLAVLGSLLLLVTLMAGPASALVRFGIHAGMDLNSQDAETLARQEINNGPDTFSIEREEIKAPLLAGVHFFFAALPYVDLELGVEGSLRKYHVVYNHWLDDVAADVADVFDEDVYFGRVSVYLSAKYNLLDLPTIQGYLGGGLGYHVMGPLLSKGLIEEETAGGDYDLDAGEILAKSGVMGFHGLAGVRFKPGPAPFAITAEGRYFFLEENDYGDDTDQFIALTLGLEFGF
ncbi:MAG: hypothetical protein JW819_05855 [Candidatus Krumholzibacteriota bacterium]|nr:hypothetical protein [Candidatus Krumholzibacteriota bacterium]